MTKRKEPPPKEPDSLERLAQFTKQILQVPRAEVRDNPDSIGTQAEELLSPET
jgi:hypothetical protein